jgi:exodeoxyribonuclease VII small subunit
MADEPEPNLEAALTRIEQIVADLERGEPSLSVALAKYEDGVKLLRCCYDLLDQAERSVALLTGVDEQGHPTSSPFDATATPTREPDAATPDPTRSGTPVVDRKSTPRSKTAGSDPTATPDLPF